MDDYPQPRPVMYGTSEEDAPPQTQTAPVRAGPPRWPPAPPMAGDWDGGSDDNSMRHNYMPAAARSRLVVRGRFVVAALYALASVYALYVVVFVPQEFAGLALLSRLFLLLQIVASVWVVSLLLATPPLAVIVSGICIIQLVLGVVAGEWLAPGTLAAIVMLLYLFFASKKLAVESMKPWGQSVRGSRWRRMSRVGRGPRESDEWRVRF